MGLDISGAAELLEQASALLGQDLLTPCLDESEREWPTAALQPTLLCVGVALARVLTRAGAAPDAVLGHSLGELTALVAGGVVSLEDAVRLAALRGRAMDRCPKGRMAAVLGMPPQRVAALCEELAAEGGVLAVSNYNSPRQTVISGTPDAVARAAARLRAEGAERVVALAIGVASHCALMEEAGQEVRAALADLTFRPPACAVYLSASGRRETDPERLREAIAASLTRPVRFYAALLQARSDGCAVFTEVGPNRSPVLLGRVRESFPSESLRTGLASDDAAAQAWASSALLGDAGTVP